jgi:multiple sugar transport system permease protein
MRFPDNLQIRRHRLGFWEAVTGWFFILPATLGLIFFQLGPVIASLLLSFTNYDIVSPPKWVGFGNYVKMLTADEFYAKSVRVTIKYTVLAIPLSIITSYAIALLMNQGVKGVSLFRTIWYLPTLVPSVATAFLWGWLLNREYGPINWPIKALGLSPIGWLTDPPWVVPALVLVRIWGAGNTALIFLAGLQGVPRHLYDAAEVDGAGWWAKFRHVTIPMTSSIIFFNLIMGIIGSFQVFGIAYIMFDMGTQGWTGVGGAGPDNAALFYVLYLYRQAFGYFKNGYACALAWVLFMVISMLTLVVFGTQRRWVYYESEVGVR